MISIQLCHTSVSKKTTPVTRAIPVSSQKRRLNAFLIGSTSPFVKQLCSFNQIGLPTNDERSVSGGHIVSSERDTELKLDMAAFPDNWPVMTRCVSADHRSLKRIIALTSPACKPRTLRCLISARL